MSGNQGVIFLHKDKFDIYLPNLPKILEFRFVPEIIRDLEIINKDLLTNLITLFISNNHLTATNVVMVLADSACFIKDFNTPQVKETNNQMINKIGKNAEIIDQKQNQENLINDFVENVPFEKVSTKRFQTGAGTKVVAVNKDFFEAIRHPFEKAGFIISEVFPGIVFGNMITSKPNLDIIAVNTILSQLNAHRNDNILIEDKLPQSSIQPQEVEESADFIIPEQDTTIPAKTNKKRLIIMLLVFAVLLIILVFMALNPPT